MPLVLETEETLLSRLEEQLKLFSTRPALKTESSAWSYAELDAISARCAAAVQNEFENRFAPVALMMKHDGPLLAVIIGILRSGGFYFVLNPTLPSSRLAQIVEEVRPRAIVTDAEHEHAARELDGPKIEIRLFDELQSAVSSFYERPILPSSPCALFYTSGSSQKPRPLVYTHGGTLQNVANHSRSLQITAADRITLLSPCSAAASVSSLFGALLKGACLLPFNPVREGLHKMEDWINREKISVYHSVPSLFRRFAQTLAANEPLRAIRAVKLGGEPVFASDVELFRKHFRRDAVLINGLGLTEANGNACHFEITHDTRIAAATVPVGRPLEGIEIKLLAADGSEAAAGETGEIALRGKYVAPGFWTGSEVRPNAAQVDGWFRTGDLGRRNSEGFFEHLGRKDDQLKLRGQWVSVGEIEAALMQISGVREAAVTATEHAGTEKGITAFVTWKNGALPQRELRSALRHSLPPHSVPHHVLTLPQLPVLPNGKIDRTALSQEAAKQLTTQRKQLDSSDPLVLQLVRIWQKVLENSAVGATEDFFSLGGDSLAAATMLAAVENFFGVDLPVSVLLEAPTVEKLAALIRKGGWSEGQLRLVALQLRGSKPPLYCVPGAGSEALALRELAAQMGDDQPFVAFQPQGLDGRMPYLRSVEEMAAYYIDSLRRHQPRGPYRLCGTSAGGVIAFEMANQLGQAGDEVRFLALFDSYGGEYPKRRKDLSPAKKLKLALRQFLPLHHAGSVTLRALREGAKEWVQRRLIDLDLRFNFRSAPRPYRLRFLYLQEVCFAARRRYQLRPFSGKIDLFRIEHQPSAELFEQDPLLGWADMAAEGIEVHDLPGYHGQHLREPNVAILARELTACLERVCLGSVRFRSNSKLAIRLI
jgi:acyl-coenzyme A synthetase/AMP-(fatty) acid ligase/thioesterase domain-containing protein/acyl carrier protein